MSNYLAIFFLLLPACMAPGPRESTQGGPVSLVAEAERFMQSGYGEEAEHILDSLRGTGYFSVRSLLLRASLAESRGDFVGAIYALRKAGRDYGQPEATLHATDLFRRLHPAGEINPNYRDDKPGIPPQHPLALLLLLVGMLALATVSLFVLRRIPKIVGTIATVAGLVLLLSLIQLAKPGLQSRRAIVLSSSPLYRAAGFASQLQSEPLPSGAELELLGIDANWAQIRYLDRAGYVPKWTIRPL